MLLFLSGCSTTKAAFDWYNIPEFDSVEYNNFITLHVTLENLHGVCNDVRQSTQYVYNIDTQYRQAVLFTIMSNDSLIGEPLRTYESLLRELIDRYASDSPSTTYCEIKTQGLISTSASIIDLLGTRR